MKKFIVFIAFFLGAYGMSFAQTLSDAEKAYAQNEFQKAAGMYEKLLEEGESPRLYYNLGNCYYRLEMPSKALLNYERAALLDPSDKDVRANIEFVQRQLLPGATRPTQFFFVTWWNDLRDSMNLQAWIVCGISAFVLFLLSVSVYLFIKNTNLRKGGFFASLFFLVVCVGANHFAYVQYKRLTVRDTAIVLSAGAVVRSAPTDTGTALTTLPVGLKITVTDDSMKEWKEIEFNDGKVGWLKASEIEVI